MFWSKPKLPVTQKDKEWIESTLLWLLDEFGSEFFLKQTVILPESCFFPDKFHGTIECVCKITDRICTYMHTDSNLVEIDLFSEEDDLARDHRLGGSESNGAAGLYFHKPSPDRRHRIAINTSQLNNPTRLVATISHELGHVILLGGNRISPDFKSHEYLTDLLTVFHGMGVFTANAVIDFSQWQDNTHQGWSISRQGYMTEEMFGYALASCAWLRGDTKAEWQKHLSTNARAYFKSSLKYLSTGGETTLKQIGL